MTAPQTFKLDEFSTGEWSDRPEYSSDGIEFEHIKLLHQENPNFVEYGKCGDTDYWYFLDLQNEITFDFHLYLAGSWLGIGAEPLTVEPFMWVYGTVFDGVRECSGGQNFTGNLIDMANALTWLHENCETRWPRFKEWYDG